MATSKKIIKSKVNPLELPTLFFAGNSRLTFRNQNTGTHMTVHVKQLKDRNKKDERGQRVRLPIFYLQVSLLGDSAQGYLFAGTIFQEDMKVKLHHTHRPDSQMAKVVAFIMAALKDPERLRAKNVALFHEGRCCRCGLPLTHPQSIERALGDDCYEYTNKKSETESPL